VPDRFFDKVVADDRAYCIGHCVRKEANGDGDPVPNNLLQALMNQRQDFTFC
jgi:hypothetical protein